MFKTHAEYKAAEAAAVAGLTGKAKQAAKAAFYNANKDAIRALLDGAALEQEAARRAAMQAEADAIQAAAAAHGLTAHATANVGYCRGTSYDTVVLVGGNTFAHKDALKAHGATWHGPSKSWVFPSVEAFMAAMKAL